MQKPLGHLAYELTFPEYLTSIDTAKMHNDNGLVKYADMVDRLFNKRNLQLADKTLVWPRNQNMLTRTGGPALVRFPRNNQNRGQQQPTRSLGPKFGYQQQQDQSRTYMMAAAIPDLYPKTRERPTDLKPGEPWCTHCFMKGHNNDRCLWYHVAEFPWCRGFSRQNQT